MSGKLSLPTFFNSKYKGAVSLKRLQTILRIYPHLHLAIQNKPSIFYRTFFMYILDNENKINTKIVLEENGQYKVKTNEEVVGKICGVGTIAENRDVIGIIYIDDDFYFVHNERKILIDIQTFYMNNRLSEDGERIFEVYNEGMKLLNYLYQPYIDPGSLTYGLDDEEFDAILRFSNLWGKSSDLSKIKRYLDYVNKINMYMV